MSAARNSALDLATGEWISFVDSDDWCELTMYEKVIAKAEESNSDIVMYSHYANSLKSESEIHAFSQSFDTSDPALVSHLQLNVISRFYNPYPSTTAWSQGLPWDKLYKASLIYDNHLRFAENVKAQEDRLFNVHAFQYAKKVSFIDEALYHWRWNSTSIGHKYTPNRAAIDRTVFQEFLSIGEKYGLSEEYYQAINELLVTEAVTLGNRCFFNPQNTKSLREKFEEANKVLHSEPIYSAFKSVSKERLPRAAKMVILRQHSLPSVFMIYLLAKVQNFKARNNYF